MILVTSALPQEGKTTTSINTAIVLAQKGTRVLLIDADLRRPSIHKALNIATKIGLSNVLTGNATMSQATVRSTILPTLFVLPAGPPPPNPAELLASAQMKDSLAELREQYDHIVIDSPPVLAVTDARIIAAHADVTIMVLRADQTRRKAAKQAREQLDSVGANTLGLVINCTPRSTDRYGYGGGYGSYGYYYQAGARKKKEVASVN